MTTIDIHAHFVDRHYVDDLARVMALDAERTTDGKTLLRERGATIAWTRPDMFAVEYRLADMAQKNIDMRVLSVSAPNVYPWPVTEQVEIARHVNDALSRYCRAHPKKFIGLASLPLADVGASLREIDRAVHELGLKGVAIGSNIGGVALNDARFEPLWAKINALRLPVVEHPSLVSEGYLRHGRIRASAARRADVRHDADGGSDDLCRHLRTLPRFPVCAGAYGGGADHADGAAG
jgi:aminocarboxymuconate-semialdehyde decarboxylase